jgi:hypothetical protein
MTSVALTFHLVAEMSPMLLLIEPWPKLWEPGAVTVNV